MTGFSSSPNNDIDAALRSIDGAASHAAGARDWCLRANTANWESPAAAVFSRWLAELAVGAHQGVHQVAELRATGIRV